MSFLYQKGYLFHENGLIVFKIFFLQAKKNLDCNPKK